jgi:hypothetical protein
VTIAKPSGTPKLFATEFDRMPRADRLRSIELLGTQAAPRAHADLDREQTL